MEEHLKEIIKEVNRYNKLDNSIIIGTDYNILYKQLLNSISEIPNKRIKNLKDEVYYDLKVLGYIGKNNKNHAIWLCICICGNFKLVVTTDLKTGHVKSCGCRSLRMLQERNKNNQYGKKHGLSHDRIYNIYANMIQRCTNSKVNRFKNYGGRGIKVCDEWLENFMNFYNWAIENGYEEQLTIERIDVNGNYEPNNCTWITNKEQQNNRTNNVNITINGETLNMRQWSKATGVNEKTIEKRIRMGWQGENLIKEEYERKVTKDMEQEICKLYDNDKLSKTEIGRIFNISSETVRRYINKNKEETV